MLPRLNQIRPHSSRITRFLWWLVASGRPRGWWEVGPVLALFGLALAGALAIAWPWLLPELQRLLLAAADLLAAGWSWLWGTLQRGLGSL